MSVYQELVSGGRSVTYFNLRFVGAWLLVLMFCEKLQALEKGQVTGLDISLESLSSAYYDRPFRATGRVYEVIGIAGLRPVQNAEVRARLGGKWMTFTTDEQGGFTITVKVPKEEDFNLIIAEAPELELNVTKGRHTRDYAFPVTLESPLHATVRTDRKLYEPGETVHFWSRIDDASTGRPLGGIPVVITLSNLEKKKTVTSASGVAAVDFKLKSNAESGTGLISIEAEGLYLASMNYSIDRRATTDLLISVKATPETVGPGEPVSIEVEVRSVRGTPMRGADVSIDVSSKKFQGRTQADGKVRFDLNAPEYSTPNEGTVQVSGTVHHAGCRAEDFSAGYKLRALPSYNINVIIPARGLVPEVDDRLIVSVETEDGKPRKAGTTVEFRGTAFKNKSVKAAVDRHGFVSVPIRLNRLDYAMHASGDCASKIATTVEVIVKSEGSAAKTERLCIPVSERALVIPFVQKPAVGPGDPIDVTIQRRPEAAGLTVSVELFCGQLGGPIDTKVASISLNSVRFFAPKDRLGLCTVWARPMLDINKSPSFGLGVSDPVLVRPAVPSFPTLTVDREQYSIKGRAKLTIHSETGVPQSWAAVVARDVAQHQGEVPFDEYFMNRELQQAVLDPSTKAADILVRAAMIAYTGMEENDFEDDETETPGPKMEYDAARLAFPLRNNAAGRWMLAVEQLLATSLKAGTMEHLVIGKGPSVRFRGDAMDLALEGQEEDWNLDGEDETSALTLGQEKVTTDMLTDLDPSFTFETAARRVARNRLVQLLAKLTADLNPEENDETRSLGRSAVPAERILSDMVRRGVFSPTDLHDPWGNTFQLQKTGRRPRFVLSRDLEGYELLSPGPDGLVGTDDDIQDPWTRVVQEGTLYARVSGEDRLMAKLSAISPGAASFDKLNAAYDRLNDEAVEELIGDGLKGIGYGGGEGSGSGYGSGSGSLGGSHRASAPSCRPGATTFAGRALAGVLREDFPATLYFKAEQALSPTGSTTLEIPLAHAATTYIVEAIIWREDGWSWSASTEIHVDQDLLVDAPLPEKATVGDQVILPVRLSNRTDKVKIVRIAVTGTDELGITPIEIDAVQVPPKDTIEIPVTISLSKVASGKVTIAAFDTANQPIDAVRRAIVVKPSHRRASAEATEIVRGHGELSLSIPRGAEASGRSGISISTGSAVFGGYSTVSWSKWLNGLAGREVYLSDEQDQFDLADLHNEEDPAELAMHLGAEWANRNSPPMEYKRALETLADHIDKVKPKDANSVRLLSRILMLLAPAVLHVDKLEALGKQLSTLVGKLRIKVEMGAALFADAPQLCARSAAALLFTSPKKKGGARALELLKRARQAVVTIDEDQWVEGGPDDPTDGGDELFVSSALLALAETREGNDDDAFKLLGSLARLVHSDPSSPIRLDGLNIEDRIMAEAAAVFLGEDRSTSKVTVIVDGKPHSVDITNGYGSLESEILGRGGEHHIEIKGKGTDIIMLEASAKYTVDWNTLPIHVGPFAVRVDGRAGQVDDRSGLSLIVRNRIPRVIPDPVVEIELPAGAELNEEARQSLERWTVLDPQVSSGTLRLTLFPMRPREEIVIPLPWLWTTAGRFTGLGVTAWAADRPEAVTVLPPRTMEVSRRAAEIGGAP
jgi:hypothetical protein